MILDEPFINRLEGGEEEGEEEEEGEGRRRGGEKEELQERASKASKACLPVALLII